jgi:pimeloyl-ACP methyl ester carboxylesterase
MSTVSKEIVQERQPFDIAWRTVDGLEIRFATDGKGDEKVVLFSPWPESILAFTPVWGGLTARFEVLAIDLPGFGQHAHGQARGLQTRWPWSLLVSAE